MRWSNQGYNYPGVYLIVSKLIEAIIHSERDPPRTDLRTWLRRSERAAPLSPRKAWWPRSIPSG